MRFDRLGKLSVKYIGPIEILRHVGEVAYEFTLPLVFSAIHQGSPCFYDVLEHSKRLTYDLL